MQSHYLSDLRDMQFNLFEFLNAARGGMDEDSIRSVLKAVDKLARNEMAASFADADRNPPEMGPDGTPILPESLKKSIKAWQDGDWHRLALREDLGGFGAPRSVSWSTFELVVGANASAGFYVFDTFISGVIGEEGTQAQRDRFFPRYVDQRWGAAMVLTEPDAGSDVGSARTVARHIEGDVWEIEGTKRFITSGDYDTPENILHLVLARPVGAKPGTKGLSMFIVPKVWVNEDGSLGERNGMRCIGLEKKMGIKGSVTCEIAYGGDTPCRGLLVGDVHDGIRQMFNVIEGARLAIGFKSMSELSTAYLNALKYAKERIQGPDLAQATAKDSPRVAIFRHPDVRRMLMRLKAHVQGMRALCYYAADLTQQLQESRSDTTLEHKLDLMLPLVKGYCSDKGYELLAVALQIFGGSGYVQDHPIEQYIRDQKIDTIYEGTTHIQALDLLFRKVARTGGTSLRALMGEVQQTLKAEEGGAELAEPRAALAQALGDVQSIFMTLMGLVGKSPYHAGVQGNRVLFALAELVMGWLLVRHAAVAVAAQPTAKGDDVAFYQGKVASARWFCREVLPGLSLTRKLVEQSSLDVMDLPDAAF